MLHSKVASIDDMIYASCPSCFYHDASRFLNASFCNPCQPNDNWSSSSSATGTTRQRDHAPHTTRRTLYMCSLRQRCTQRYSRDERAPFLTSRILQHSLPWSIWLHMRVYHLVATCPATYSIISAVISLPVRERFSSHPRFIYCRSTDACSYATSITTLLYADPRFVE